ncbi:unnamed protein product, partial [Rotaria sp. Silwood1]
MVSPVSVVSPLADVPVAIGVWPVPIVSPVPVVSLIPGVPVAVVAWRVP